MTRRSIPPHAILLFAGATWGLTTVLSRIAASDGPGPVALTFWQCAFTVMALLVVNLLRRRRLPLTGPAVRLYAFIAVAGSLVPNVAYYAAAAHLPAGVMALIISAVPVTAYPIALALGREKPQLRRLAGLALGLGAVALIVLPGAGLAPAAAPGVSIALFLGVALIAPVSYAVEAIGVEHWPGAPDPLNVLLGASLLSGLVSGPLSLALGQGLNPFAAWDATLWAVLGTALLGITAYAGYLHLVRTAGAVFGAQAAYASTFFGILWAMVLLDERYSLLIWLSVLLFAFGIALVRPRRIGQSS